MEVWLNGTTRDQINPILDLCVQEYLKLDEDGQVEFKGSAKAFTRLYSFLSQVLPYGNANWEKLSIFLNFLVNKLPAPIEEDLSKGVLEAIDMDSYRMERKAARSVSLAEEDAEIDPVLASGAGHVNEPEMDGLSNIIAQFNQTWGGIFSEPGRVAEVISRMPGQVLEDDAYRNARMNSDRQNAQIEHDSAGHAARHSDGEVPEGALQGLHRGQGLPRLAQRGDVPGNVSDKPGGLIKVWMPRDQLQQR